MLRMRIPQDPAKPLVNLPILHLPTGQGLVHVLPLPALGVAPQILEAVCDSDLLNLLCLLLCVQVCLVHVAKWFVACSLGHTLLVADCVA